MMLLIEICTQYLYLIALEGYVSRELLVHLVSMVEGCLIRVISFS